MRELNTIERVTVSVDEAAAMLGISRTSAYEYIRTGHLPAIRMGRRLLIPLKAIGDLLGDLVSDHIGATGAAPEKQRRSVGQS